MPRRTAHIEPKERRPKTGRGVYPETDLMDLEVQSSSGAHINYTWDTRIKSSEYPEEIGIDRYMRIPQLLRWRWRYGKWIRAKMRTRTKNPSDWVSDRG